MILTFLIYYKYISMGPAVNIRDADANPDYS